MTDIKVVVYTTPTCSWCKKTKEYLSGKSISYLEYDVAENKNAANEMIERSGQMGVPVIAVNGEIVVGFNQARLDSLLS